MMKRQRILLSLLAATVLVFCMTVSAGAETVTETILTTGTTQAFSAEAVPDEDIQVILAAGISTASAINQQPWFFAAITNQDLMKEIGGSGMGFGGGRGAVPEGMGTPPEGAGAPPEGTGAPAEGDPSEGAGSGMPAMPPAASGGAKASLGDSPLAIIIYMDPSSKSPAPEYDCGLATQNMVIAASALGYGVKIVSSLTMSLNGANHDQICEKLGVDTGLQAVAVLLIGKTDESLDAVSSASVREDVNAKSVIIH